MKLTTKKLKQIISEEIAKLTESNQKIRQLLDSKDEELVFQGIELATLLGEPIFFTNPVQPDVLRFFEEVDDQETIRLFLAYGMRIPKGQDMMTVSYLARNPNLTEEAMKQIIHISNEGWHSYSTGMQAKIHLAKNPSVTVGILDLLSHAEYYDLAIQVAKNPKTSAKSLERIAVRHSAAGNVLRVVLQNPKVSDELLHAAINHPYFSVREVVADQLEKRGYYVQAPHNQITDEDSDDDYEF